MNPVFELNDLHVSLQSHHQEIELVRGVSFAVAPGECLGILGESGSGKSMSMKAAMGLLDHSFHVKGSAQFQGKNFWARVPRSCAVCAAERWASFFRTR